MAPSSIALSSDTDYLTAVIVALSAICWQREHTSAAAGQLIHEYRGTGTGTGESRYRVTDLDLDLGADWWPVALVTTTGSVISPSCSAAADPETADMFAGFAAALHRAEGGAA